MPVFEKIDKDKPYPERITGEIQNQIFDKLKFNTTYIDAKISDDEKTISIVLYHEGDKVFELVEHNTSYLSLAGSHIVIYYLNPYKKAYFKRQTGVRSVEFGSIFLEGYKDGQEFIAGIRENAIYTEIIFYTAGNTSNLWKAIHEKRLEGVFV